MYHSDIVSPMFVLENPLKDMPTPKHELLDYLGYDTMFHRVEIYDMKKVIGPGSVFNDAFFFFKWLPK